MLRQNSAISSQIPPMKEFVQKPSGTYRPVRKDEISRWTGQTVRVYKIYDDEWMSDKSGLKVKLMMVLLN